MIPPLKSSNGGAHGVKSTKRNSRRKGEIWGTEGDKEVIARNCHGGRMRIISIYFAILLLTVSVSVNQGDAETDFMEELGIIQFNEKIQAPDFALKDLNGQEVKLRDFRGKIVFLNFWTTWCPPCRLEMPSMEVLHSEFKNREFIMLAVNLGENTERVRAFTEHARLTFPILLDADGSVGLLYGVRLLPTTYLIGRKGHIIGAALGPRDWASQEALAVFNHMLNTSPTP